MKYLNETATTNDDLHVLSDHHILLKKRETYSHGMDMRF